MVLFLRTDISRVSPTEFTRWLDTWDQFAFKIATKYKDEIIPSLVGLSVGIARDDEMFITLFGNKVKTFFESKQVNYRSVLGELISVVVFMKAATSKNRIVDKIESLITQSSIQFNHPGLN
jgi:hypothetical protein